MEEKDKTPAAENTPQAGKSDADKNPVERLYDKIPLTYKQVDIIVKVLIGVLVVVLILGVASGRGIGGG